MKALDAHHNNSSQFYAKTGVTQVVHPNPKGKMYRGIEIKRRASHIPVNTIPRWTGLRNMQTAYER
jgi:hypothetical protein